MVEHSSGLARISSDQLVRNARRAASIAGGIRRLIAFLPGDAFGHGESFAVKTLEAIGVGAFAANRTEDAIRFREHSASAQVIALFPMIPDDVAAAIMRKVELGISTPDEALAIDRIASDHGRARVHVRVDDEDMASQCLATIQEARAIMLMGAYAVAGNQNEVAALELRLKHLASRDRIRHRFLCSAWPQPLRFPLNRLCIGEPLFGLSDEWGVRQPEFAPVMSISTRLVDIAQSAPGSERLGLVPVGFATGLPRTAAGRAVVLVNGYRAQVTEVRMSESLIDLSDVPDAKTGLEVIVVGTADGLRLTFDDWARATGLTEPELAIRLSTRMSRVYER